MTKASLSTLQTRTTGTDETLLLNVHGSVAEITLNRPSRMNAIDVPLAHSLMLTLQMLEDREDIRCVLLKGAGTMFCAGGDLATFKERGESAHLYVKEVVTYLHEAISVVARMRAPVVAAVHGSAAGAGLALACACDIVVASETAKFVMAYTKAGLTPDGSSTWFLPRLVGLRRSLELTLLNRELSAQEAGEWGLVTMVVPPEEFEERTGALVMELADGPTVALGEAKRLLRGSINESLESQMTKEGFMVSSAMTTDDAKEGMNAFFEKRKPKFEGR